LGRDTALEMADKLQVECMQIMLRESVEVDKLVKTQIQPVGYAWFNQAHNFTNVLSELEQAFVRELEAEAAALRQVKCNTHAPCGRVND